MLSRDLKNGKVLPNIDKILVIRVDGIGESAEFDTSDFVVTRELPISGNHSVSASPQCTCVGCEP